MTTVVLAPEMRTRLRVAAAERRWVHHADCAILGPDGERADCDCGIPDLLLTLGAVFAPGDVLERGRIPRRPT